MAIEQARTSGIFDGAALRADFPVFDRPHRSGRPLAFLDSAASSPKPRAVIDALADAYGHHYANVHRGIYELSEDATQRFEGARRALARFIGAPSEREVVFVRNATEAINLVAYSWGRTNVRAGDLILSTEMEHHANLVPWQQLAIETGATIEYVRITDDGRLDLDDLRARLARGPKLVAFSQVSNSLGTINPVAEIARAAARRGRRDRPGRGAERAAHAGRRGGARRRLPRPCPATRCSVRPGSARSGAGASCSTPCRPS